MFLAGVHPAQLLDSILLSVSATETKESASATDKCTGVVTIFAEDGCVDMRLNPRNPIIALSSSQSAVMVGGA